MSEIISAKNNLTIQQQILGLRTQKFCLHTSFALFPTVVNIWTKGDMGPNCQICWLHLMTTLSYGFLSKLDSAYVNMSLIIN